MTAGHCAAYVFARKGLNVKSLKWNQAQNSFKTQKQINRIDPSVFKNDSDLLQACLQLIQNVQWWQKHRKESQQSKLLDFSTKLLSCVEGVSLAKPAKHPDFGAHTISSLMHHFRHKWMCDCDCAHSFWLEWQWSCGRGGWNGIQPQCGRKPSWWSKMLCCASAKQTRRSGADVLSHIAQTLLRSSDWSWATQWWCWQNRAMSNGQKRQDWFSSWF